MSEKKQNDQLEVSSLLWNNCLEKIGLAFFENQTNKALSPADSSVPAFMKENVHTNRFLQALMKTRYRICP